MGVFLPNGRMVFLGCVNKGCFLWLFICCLMECSYQTVENSFRGLFGGMLY